MLRIEHHDAELLDRPRSELRQQVTGHLARRDELQPRRRTPKQRAAAELDGCEHLRGLGLCPCPRRGAGRPREREESRAVLPPSREFRSRAPARCCGVSRCRRRWPRSSLSPRPAAQAAEAFRAADRAPRSLFIAKVYSTDVSLVRNCLAWVFPALFLLTACAAPPSREMDQAQGAIDAARAAGADRYAAAQYESAVKALEERAGRRRGSRLSPGAQLRARQPRSRTGCRERSGQPASDAAQRRRTAARAKWLRSSIGRSSSLAAAEAARVPRRIADGAARRDRRGGSCAAKSGDRNSGRRIPVEPGTAVGICQET